MRLQRLLVQTATFTYDFSTVYDISYSTFGHAFFSCISNSRAMRRKQSRASRKLSLNGSWVQFSVSLYKHFPRRAALAVDASRSGLGSRYGGPRTAALAFVCCSQ